MNCPDWLLFTKVRSYLQAVNVNKQKLFHSHYPESSSTSTINQCSQLFYADTFPFIPT